MRIALYNLTTTTKYGGVESFVWDLARELARRSHTVTVIGGVGPRREEAPGVRVLTFPFISRAFFQAIPPLRRAYAEAKLLERLTMAVPALPHLARGGYDIIHIQKPYDLAPALLARRLGGARVILGCHGEDFYRGDRALAAQVDAAVSCSRFNAATIHRRYGFTPRVVFNGIDTGLFRPVAPDLGLPERLGIDGSRSSPALRAAPFAPFSPLSEEGDAPRRRSPPLLLAQPTGAGGGGEGQLPAGHPGPPLLLFVGRLQPWKGVETAIRALTEIPLAHLLVAGDGEDRPRLTRIAAELGLAGRVHFPGALERHTLPQLYCSVDLLVATSHASETFGIGPVEAQACGLPVVASRFGGFPEVVDEGRTGLLVPPRDPAALAAAVRSLLDDPARRAAMAAAAPAWAAQFAWPAVTDRIEAVYRQVIP